MMQMEAIPFNLKAVFYRGEIILGILILGVVWFLRPKGPKSQFRVRESDQPFRQSATPNGLADAKIKSHREQGHSGRESQLHAPLRLEGIRIDGSPYQILGVSPQASNSEVQKAYRELMKHYHPDRVGRPGSPEWKEAQKIAEAINRAKAEILKKP